MTATKISEAATLLRTTKAVSSAASTTEAVPGSVTIPCTTDEVRGILRFVTEEVGEVGFIVKRDPSMRGGKQALTVWRRAK